MMNRHGEIISRKYDEQNRTMQIAMPQYPCKLEFPNSLAQDRSLEIVIPQRLLARPQIANCANCNSTLAWHKGRPCKLQFPKNLAQDWSLGPNRTVQIANPE